MARKPLKSRLTAGDRSYLCKLAASRETPSRSVSYDATRVKPAPVTLPRVPFLDKKDTA